MAFRARELWSKIGTRPYPKTDTKSTAACSREADSFVPYPPIVPLAAHVRGHDIVSKAGGLHVLLSHTPIAPRVTVGAGRASVVGRAVAGRLARLGRGQGGR